MPSSSLRMCARVARARSSSIGVTCLERAAQVEQQLGHLGPAVELQLDPGEHAATIPERAPVAGAARGVPLRDQLDRAQRPMLGLAPVVHGAIVPSPEALCHPTGLGSRCGKVRIHSWHSPGRVVFAA